jgi:hypothetical protein
MLQRLGVFVLFCWFAAISARGDSIAVSYNRSPVYGAANRSSKLHQTRPILSLAWNPRGNRQSIGPARIQFCGPPCFATGDPRIRVPGTVARMDSEFIGVGSRREDGMAGWLVQFLRRQFGGRTGHKMCKAAGTC